MPALSASEWEFWIFHGCWGTLLILWGVTHLLGPWWRRVRGKPPPLKEPWNDHDPSESNRW